MSQNHVSFSIGRFVTQSNNIFSPIYFAESEVLDISLFETTPSMAFTSASSVSIHSKFLVAYIPKEV